MPTPSKQQPVLLGALLIGVLSALPIISAGNVCCCLWVIVGGALSAYLLQQGYPYAITIGDGALVGLLAGMLGGIIGQLLKIPIDMMMGSVGQEWFTRFMESRSDLPPETREMLENLRNLKAGPILVMFGLVFGLVTGAIFGTLGGILGAAVFKKGTPPPPPGTIDVPPVPPPPASSTGVPPSPPPPPVAG